jgi:hypothetical protein
MSKTVLSLMRKHRKGLIVSLLLVSALGFFFVFWYSLSPSYLGFPFYLVAGPVFLALLPLSLTLALRAIDLWRLPVAIGLVGIFLLAFALMVPLVVTARTEYSPECQMYYTVHDWKSVAYSYFGLGFHYYYPIDVICRSTHPAVY